MNKLSERGSETGSVSWQDFLRNTALEVVRFFIICRHMIWVGTDMQLPAISYININWGLGKGSISGKRVLIKNKSRKRLLEKSAGRSVGIAGGSFDFS